MTLPTDKAELRRAMRKLRRRLAEHTPAAGVMAAQVLARHGIPAPPGAALAGRPVFSTYWFHGSEMPTNFLREFLLASGWREAMPTAVSLEVPLSFRAFMSGDPLGPDLFNLPAPLAGAAELPPDLLIVPLLAFDRRGGRLGQGGGLYDRTLANLRATKPVFVLGLAYAAQELEEVPMETHDQRLDAILTETAFIAVAREG